MRTALALGIAGRSTKDPLRGLIVYTSDPDTPFLDPAQ
jgi:hypothetical protein